MRDLYFYHEIEDMYEEMLDECCEPARVCSYEYAAGSALKALDPIAFRCGVSDWSSEEFEELGFNDLTEEEQEKYIATKRTVMYCRHEDL